MEYIASSTLSFSFDFLVTMATILSLAYISIFRCNLSPTSIPRYATIHSGTVALDYVVPTLAIPTVVSKLVLLPYLYIYVIMKVIEITINR